jgi:hypothetical protein
MPSPDAQPGYKPSQEAVAILCESLQRMGVSMSEPAARSLLESVLAVEGPRLDALARGTLQASLEAIRNAAEAALISLTGKPPGSTRRDYELSFPPASQSVTTSGQRRHGRWFHASRTAPSSRRRMPAQCSRAAAAGEHANGRPGGAEDLEGRGGLPAPDARFAPLLRGSARIPTRR